MYCMNPLVTVSMETKWSTKKLTCDCTSRHGTRFVQFTVFEIQGLKLNNNNNNNNNKNKKQKKNCENELFVISPLLVM